MIDEEEQPMGMNYNDIVKMLADNYTKIEQSIVNQILLNVSSHYPTVGSYRETVWKSLFEMIVPRKYCIEQGVFIIDSYGHVSKEVDLAIFDEMYTPYIFNYGEIKFIPIEAVAAVVQCKSNTVVLKEIRNWAKSIECLLTSMDSVARIASGMIVNSEVGDKKAMQTATRPIMLLCAMTDIGKLKKCENQFDIILTVDQEKGRLLKYIREEKASLLDWHISLNHSLENNEKSYEIEKEMEWRGRKKKDDITVCRDNLLQELAVGKIENNEIIEENVLLSLIFQLNQLLMVLNNPMLFPHRAYAKCFTKVLSEFGKGEDNSEQK